jgi:Na+/H+ antiporter NhaC
MAPPQPSLPGSNRRLSNALATLLLALSAFLWVSADGSERERDALACAEAYRALVWVGPRAADSLGQRALAGSVLPGPEPGSARLTLGSVSFRDPSSQARPELDRILRRSVARGLRSAAEAGIELPGGGRAPSVSLSLVGELVPAPDGQRFELERLPGAVRLQWSPPAGPPRSVDWPFTPPDQRALLPPLVAIALAIATRRPIPSLFGGVLAGSILVRLQGGSGPWAAWSEGAQGVFTRYLFEKISSAEKLQIVAFVALMLAMVGNLTLNGGLRGLMDRLSRLAKGPRSAQLCTYGMGLLIFFDDYANTILVGSTMRPLSDRFRVAREKLAYLVDSTAAPVAGLSLFSTWIAFEVSTYAAQLPAAGLSSAQGYEVFLQTLPYRFYSWFTLALVALLVLTGRDFGPMLAAERRARRYGLVLRPGAVPLAEGPQAPALPAGVHPAAWRALVPVTAFLGVTLFEIARRGGAFGMSFEQLRSLQGLLGVLARGSGNAPLMIGSAVGFALAVLASLSAGLGAREVLLGAWGALRSMGAALCILYLAWGIGSACEDLGTAPYLALQIEGLLEPLLLPLVLFLLSGAIAFATGSSWGTMSILLPLVVGLAFQLGAGTHLGGLGLMLLSIGAVLEGAIFGDHCSPISDTTVLSSIACSADHLDHVRTQLPYALTANAVALFCGYLPAALIGIPASVCLGAGLATLLALVLCFGRKAEAPLPRA